MSRPGPEARTAKAVGGLLAFYATGRTGDATADVKLRGYMVAVDDLPAWAVAEAIRRWFRGSCGGDQNYEFAPSPATLRRVADGVSRLAKGQYIIMRRILAAEPIADSNTPSPDRIEAMRAEFKAALEKTGEKAGMANPHPVPAE